MTLDQYLEPEIPILLFDITHFALYYFEEDEGEILRRYPQYKDGQMVMVTDWQAYPNICHKIGGGRQ